MSSSGKPSYNRLDDDAAVDEERRRLASRPYSHDEAYSRQARYSDSGAAATEAGTSYSSRSAHYDGTRDRYGEPARSGERWSPAQSRTQGGAVDRGYHGYEPHYGGQHSVSRSPDESRRGDAPSGLPRAPRPDSTDEERSPPAALSDISATRLRTDHDKGATPEGFAKVRDGRRYQLVVVQHPNRARMCGFGDKDRRPLSPTLIVKLIITDETTGAEVSPLEVNTSLFLLATDLCHPDSLMVAPRNILVHHHGSTLASAAGGSYGAAAARPGPASRSPGEGDSVRGGTVSYAAPRRNGQGDSGEGASGQLPPISSLDLPGRAGAGNEISQESASSQRSYERGFGGPNSAMFGGGGMMPGPAESYTRNLVGAAVASASVLKDEADKWSIFFVFQDISVRTEGVYRIKLMFVNLEV